MNIKQSLKRIWIESKQATKYATNDKRISFEVARKYLNKCEKILDLGSGNGQFIELFGRNDIYALDGNEESVNKLKNLTRNAVHAILPNIPFPDRYFDGIHASHILEHLWPDDFYSTLKEMNRVLKVGGILVLSSPMLWEGFYRDLSHIKPYDPEILTKYLCMENISRSLTRAKIGDYKVRDLIYRYQLQELNPIMIRYLHPFNFVIKLFTKLLKKIGIGHFCKNGYTIILEKTR
jgi:SAM-dependent methyltransferase